MRVGDLLGGSCVDGSSHLTRPGAGDTRSQPLRRDCGETVLCHFYTNIPVQVLGRGSEASRNREVRTSLLNLCLFLVINNV